MSHLSALCGIKEPLSTDMSICIVKFLKDEYKDFSYQEIEKAFTEYIKFNLENVKENYGVFSPRFVANVLIEYRKLRNKQLNLYYRAIEEEKRNAVKEVTEEEKQEIEKDYLKTVLFDKYNQSMVDGTPFYLDTINAIMCFKKFYSKGLIDITEQDKFNFNLRATKYLKEPENKGKTKEEQAVFIKEKSCELFFNQYLKVQKAKKIDLKEMYYF